MLEDKILIKKIQQGETELIELLIEKYYSNIYAFCYRKISNSNIAYDLTQEVFLRLVQYINTYVDKNNFKSYLFKIAVNICNDYYRKNKVHMEDIDAINYIA